MPYNLSLIAEFNTPGSFLPSIVAYTVIYSYLYRMINKDRLKPWNDLPKLPISKDLYLDDYVYRLLADVKGALGELKGTARLIPNQGMLINTLSLQEAKASSEIENIYTTDDELYAAFSSPDMIEGTAKEVLNYREALWKGYELFYPSGKFSMDKLISIYKIVKQTNEGIRDPLRKTVIRKGGSSITAGDIVYTPPRGVGIIESFLDNLFEYLNNDDEDPIIKMCLAHYQFETIHPFSDGNGRTGRILNVLNLCTSGFIQFPILYLSKYILDNKNDYYYHLSGVSQRGAWKNWLIFMLKAIISTAHHTLSIINNIVEAEEFVKAKIKRDTPQLDKEELVKLLFTQPFITVKMLEQNRIGTEKTCRKYLEALTSVPVNILKRISISGRVYYMNIELVEAIRK